MGLNDGSICFDSQNNHCAPLTTVAKAVLEDLKPIRTESHEDRLKSVIPEWGDAWRTLGGLEDEERLDWCHNSVSLSQPIRCGVPSGIFNHTR